MNAPHLKKNEDNILRCKYCDDPVEEDMLYCPHCQRKNKMTEEEKKKFEEELKKIEKEMQKEILENINNDSS